MVQGGLINHRQKFASIYSTNFRQSGRRRLVVPTSTSAQPAIFRPEAEVLGRQTRLLVDQMRAIDTNYLGRNVGFLNRVDLAELEHRISEYLGLLTI